MKKCTSYIIALLMIVSLFGCSDRKNEVVNGFQINNWGASLGSVNEDNLDESRYSYTLFITSDTEDLGSVREVYPIIGENIKNRLIQNEIPKMSIKDNYIEVEGKIVFDTKGLTKEQILELEPYIVNVRIVTEHMIDLSVR